jgi:transcriptional regulator with XRE-family HTH domain
MADVFGARLKELRRRAGITQQALAQSAGLSVSTVARLEQGGRPAPETVALLARALGVPVGSLDPPAEGGADGGCARE